jgi:hypothetical protein
MIAEQASIFRILMRITYVNSSIFHLKLLNRVFDT